MHVVSKTDIEVLIILLLLCYNCMSVGNIGNFEQAYSEELVDASEVELLEFVDVDKVAIQ